MNRLSTLTCLFAAIAATGVSAQALPDGDWTGFYAGLQIGRHDLEYHDPRVPGGILFDGAGISYGLHAGYARDFGRFVLGAEADVDFSSTGLSTTPTNRPAPRQVKRMASVKAIAGFDAGQFMPYAAVGHAWQDFDDTLSRANDLTFTGLTYGIGLKIQLRPNLMAGVELTRFDLDPDNPRSSLTAEGSTVSLRLSYRF